MMIPNPFTRPMTAWTTVLVLLLHGMTVWAMMSVDSPTLPETKNRPNAIQLEFITVDAQPTNPSSTSPATDEPLSKSLPLSSQPPLAENPPTEPVEKTETAKPLPQAEVEVEGKTESVEPLISKVEKVEKKIAPVINVEDNRAASIKNTAQPTESSDTQTPLNTPSSVQELSIIESRKIVSASTKADKADDNEEDYLSAMIRGVTEKYNREQAIQKQSAAKQADRKQREKEEWQAQAEYEAFSHMLEQAANQAEQQAEYRANLTNKLDQESFVVAESGSWMGGEAPNTSISSVIWRNVDRKLGDVFIVMLELHIDKEGNITEVQLLEPSGSPIVDAVATTQVRAGQLNPIIKDDKAVDAIVPMSLVYERP